MAYGTEHRGNFKALLKARIGQHGVPTKLVSECTGISERRVQSHIAHDGTNPNADDVLAYIQFFGPEFLNTWTQQVGLTGSYRPTKIQGCILRNTLHATTLAADLARVLSKASEDGKIDHIERIELPKSLLSGGNHFLALSASYGSLH